MLYYVMILCYMLQFSRPNKPLSLRKRPSNVFVLEMSFSRPQFAHGAVLETSSEQKRANSCSSPNQFYSTSFKRLTLPSDLK